MNGQLLLKFYLLLYFVEPGSFDSSTEGCFCEVSSSTDAGLFMWCQATRSRPSYCWQLAFVFMDFNSASI